MDLGLIAELGVAGIAMIAVVIALDIARKKFRESEKGDRRAPSNGLQTTLKGMLTNLDSSTKMLVEILHSIEETRVEIRRVADVASLHATGSRSEKVREESRDLLRELLMEIKHRGV